MYIRTYLKSMLIKDKNILDIIGQVFSNNSESKTTLQFSIFTNTTALDHILDSKVITKKQSKIL